MRINEKNVVFHAAISRYDEPIANLRSNLDENAAHVLRMRKLSSDSAKRMKRLRSRRRVSLQEESIRSSLLSSFQVSGTHEVRNTPLHYTEIEVECKKRKELTRRSRNSAEFARFVTFTKFQCFRGGVRYFSAIYLSICPRSKRYPQDRFEYQGNRRRARQVSQHFVKWEIHFTHHLLARTRTYSDCRKASRTGEYSINPNGSNHHIRIVRIRHAC